MGLLLGNQVKLTPALSQHCCFCFPDMLGTLRLVKCWEKKEQHWLQNEDVLVVTSAWEVSADKVQWSVLPLTSAKVTAQ